MRHEATRTQEGSCHQAKNAGANGNAVQSYGIEALGQEQEAEHERGKKARAHATINLVNDREQDFASTWLRGVNEMLRNPRASSEGVKSRKLVERNKIENKNSYRRQCSKIEAGTTEGVCVWYTSEGVGQQE